MTSASPLARFPLVRTTSAEETRAALSCTYAKPNMEFTDREQKLQTVVNLCQLVDVGLVYASCAASLRFEYPETDLASQIFSIDGRCEVMTGGASVAIRPDCGVVISPGESLQITSSAEYRRLVLTIKSRALARTLSTLTGQSCGRPLRFNPKQNYALPSAKALREHFFFLVGILNDSTAPMPNLVLAEFEQALTVMFLHANHHNFSHLLEQAPPFVAPWQIDRAEAYIRQTGRHRLRWRIFRTSAGRVLSACGVPLRKAADCRRWNLRAKCGSAVPGNCCCVRTTRQRSRR
jgi:hypothetical protein